MKSVKAKIFHKIAGVTILSLFIVTISLGIVSYTIFKEEFIQTRTTEASSLITFTAQEIASPLYLSDIEKMMAILENAQLNKNIRNIFVINPNGKIVADGTRENTLFNKQLADDFSKLVIKNKALTVDVYNNIVYVGVPIETTEHIGYIRAEFELKELDLIFNEMVKDFLFISIITTFFVSIISTIISFYISKPIMAVRNAAISFSKGNLDEKAEVTSSDEVGDLAITFNEMAEKLKRMYNTLDNKVIELEAEITRRKKAESTLIEEKERSEFYLDLFGHDIRNRNQGVISYLELGLQSANNLNAKIKSFLNSALFNAFAITKLVEDVQTITKIKKKLLTLENIDLKIIIDKAVEKVKNDYSNKNIKIKSSLPDEINILGNPLLADVFYNILSNAVKFCRETTAEIEIIATLSEDKKIWKFQIIDNGPGISDNMKSKIFKRTADEDVSKRGSGLGLTVVNEVVSRCNGKLWIEDRVPGNPSKGANFNIILKNN